MERFECQDITAELSALLDGELDPETRHLAEVHLASCGQCRRRLEDAELLDAETRATMTAHEALWSDRMEERIWTAVRGVSSYSLAQRIRRLRWAAWCGWLTAAAAVLVAGFVLIQSGQPDRLEDSDSLVSNTPIDVSSSADESLEASVVVPAVVAPNMANEPEKGPPLFFLEPPDRWTQIDAESTEPAPIEVERLADDRLMRFRDQGLVSDRLRNAIAHWAPGGGRSIPAHQRVPVLSAAIDVQPAFYVFSPDEPIEHSTSIVTSSCYTSDVLHRAAILLSMLRDADAGGGDLYWVRQVLIADDLVSELLESRADFDEDTRALVDQAWTVLEWAYGSSDWSQLERLQDRLTLDGIPERLEELSDRVW